MTATVLPPGSLTLHQDRGAPMIAHRYLDLMSELGITCSHSRPRVSNENPYSEAILRTLKYVPGYPKQPFASLDEARQWVHGFVTWYNTEHCHSGIRFVTPQQRHDGKDTAILQARAAVYEAAKAVNPGRWRGRPVRD